jgi:hypothetical protein
MLCSQTKWREKMDKLSFRNKRKINRKQTVTAIALILMLTATIAASSPTSAVVPKNVPTWAFLSLRPNPVGIGQEVLVSGWTCPPPYMYTTLGLTAPPGQITTDGKNRTNYWITMTKPDGRIDKIGPMVSDGPGTFWFTFNPDQLGTWTVEFSWPGDEYFQPANATQKLVVQKEPIPSYPDAALPTDQWVYPINRENKDWAAISGGWFQPKYDASASNYNPYSKGPETAHVLWKLPAVSGIGGLIGGPSGEIVGYSGSSANINIVMAGRGYYSSGGNVICVDLRTGNTLWSKPGSYTVGAIRSNTPVLYSFGSRFIVYDGLTGAVSLNVTGLSALGGSQGLGLGFMDPYVYSAQTVGNKSSLIKWSVEGTSTNFTSRIVYNVTWPFAGEDPHQSAVGEFGVAWDIKNQVMTQLQWPFYSESGSIDLKTGKKLWGRVMLPQEASLTSRGAFGATDGLGIMPVQVQQLYAWNMTTGEIAWKSQKTADPWGGFWAYQYCSGYDMIYKLTYAGVYAFNATNGKIVWYYPAVDTTNESPYTIQAPGESGLEQPVSVYPFGSSGGLLADGKFYAPNNEHSPTVIYRGQQLHCINAFNGQKIWSIQGYWSTNAIAEGTLFATNSEDACSYAFAKGETATTVATSSKVVDSGTAMLIEGTVTDSSPAQAGTAAVSDDSMTGWMEYLHMQKPMPTDAKGVSVKLSAVDSNGNSQDIGTVTSDTNGAYSTLWTPITPSTYTIVAEFAGTNSYYPSSAQTALGVSSLPTIAPTLTPEPFKTVNQVSAEAFYAFAAAIILLVIIVAVLFYRKK